MKKILLVMPLMVVSLLSNYGCSKTESTYSIIFKNDGDEDKKIENIKAGSIITENIPTPSERQGYTFVGWCTDSEGKYLFDFSKIKIYQDYTLYSGWKENDPEPTDDYKVNEQEFKKALGMENVEYLQASMVDGGTHDEDNFTPTSYQHITESASSYSEYLILKDGENYLEYQRSSKDEPLTPVTYRGGFMTPVSFANVIFSMFIDNPYSNYYFIDEPREYISYYEGADMVVILLQFFNKKLTKCDLVRSSSSNIRERDRTFAYERVEPPTPPSI